MKASIALLFSALASATVLPTHHKERGAINYQGHKVARVKSSPEVLKAIADHHLDVWNGGSGSEPYVDVRIPPGTTALDGFDKEIMHENLGDSMAKEADYQQYQAGSPNITWFKSYHSYATHLQWLNDLAAAHQDNAEVVTIGKSGKGQDITGIHLYGKSGKGKNPAVVIHGTVHAREWITTKVTEYFAWNLLSNYTDGSSLASYMDKYDFYFFPVVNPDGFSYTQTNDRMWRKNRISNSGSSCVGTDINRNWPYQWGTGGSSADPCEEDFRGHKPGDAPETQVHSAFLKKMQNSTGLALYIDYHSFSQLFMSPYGYSCTRQASNADKYQQLTSGAVAAIKAVYGTIFKAGPICTTIYQASGSSVDYVQDVVKGRYAFTSELRDTGRYGFVLPPNQILPSSVEAFAGFEYLLKNI